MLVQTGGAVSVKSEFRQTKPLAIDELNELIREGQLSMVCAETAAELRTFVDCQRFERLGVFEYSPEPGTPAASLPNAVPVAQKSRAG